MEFCIITHLELNRRPEPYSLWLNSKLYEFHVPSKETPVGKITPVLAFPIPSLNLKHRGSKGQKDPKDYHPTFLFL